MKLAGLHSLETNDLPLMESILLERKSRRKPKNLKKKSSGYYKNDSSPVAKAYRTTNKTQAALAKAAGVNPSTISRYKSNKVGIHRNPSLNTLKRLARAGVPASVFVS